MTNKLANGKYPTGNRLEGKVALVTGGARGLGASFARAVVAQGGKVVVADVLDDIGNNLAQDLGTSARYVHLDVTNRSQWSSAVQFALDSFGLLNILVNNAGIAHSAPIGEYPPEQWDTIMAINLTGVFNGINAALDALKTSAPSSIVNISSIAGIQGFAGAVGYCAAKFGVTGLTKSVALDVAKFDIRCNSVHPGLFDTPMTAGMDQHRKQSAMGRIGQPEELASLIVYLASDESSFCTGAEFVCDGGETAGLAPDALSG